MYTRFVTFFLLLLATGTATGQDWKTVRLDDTTYFSGGKIGTAGQDSNVLRVIWVDSVAVSGADSIFYFYKALRYNIPCIDSIADSWLGPGFIKTAGGTEHYFNAAGDTIHINPGAGAWMMYEKGSLSFAASLSGTDTMTIDGVNDSIKTFVLQAYNGAQAINHWYNNKRLVLSKNHGWVVTLDFYRFPDIQPQQGSIIGAVPDSQQHHRLSKTINEINIADLSPFARYAPGNEWIRKSIFAFSAPNSPVPGSSYRHDSVINAQLINATTLVISLSTVVSGKSYSPSGWTYFDAAYVHTDTILAGTTIQKLGTTAFPDYNWDLQQLSGQANTHPHYKKYFVDTFCSRGRYLIQSRTLHHASYGLDQTNNCMTIYPGLSGLFRIDWDYLQGFGYTYYVEEFGSGGTTTTGYEYPYIKLGNCSIGTKINVATLGIASAENKPKEISIVPVPANQTITLHGLQPGQQATITVMDLSGRKILEQHGAGKGSTIDVGSLIPGTYLAEIVTEGQRQIQKLVIGR